MWGVGVGIHQEPRRGPETRAQAPAPRREGNLSLYGDKTRLLLFLSSSSSPPSLPCNTLSPLFLATSPGLISLPSKLSYTRIFISYSYVSHNTHKLNISSVLHHFLLEGCDFISASVTSSRPISLSLPCTRGDTIRKVMIPRDYDNQILDAG